MVAAGKAIGLLRQHAVSPGEGWRGRVCGGGRANLNVCDCRKYMVAAGEALGLLRWHAVSPAEGGAGGGVGVVETCGQKRLANATRMREHYIKCASGNSL